MTASQLAVVVVNFGSHALLDRNLGELTKDLSDADVVVVDSYRSPADRLAVSALCSKRGWNLVLPDVNVGFGRGMNIGVAQARNLGAEVFLLINPDAFIAVHDVLRLRDRVLEQPLSLVSPRILRPDGRAWFDGSDLYLCTGRTRSTKFRDEGSGPVVEWLTAACVMVSRQLWDLVGGFDEDYFLYWEDVDLSVRVSRAGGDLIVDHSCSSVHDEGGTQQAPSSWASRLSDTYYYYNIRNRLLFAGKHLAESDLNRWSFRRGGSEALQILLRGGRRQFLRPWVPLRIAMRATVDGRRLAKQALAARQVARLETG